jgi:ubiquinone/menaquinone biosynthesis C-methylase UbiE
MTRLSDFRNNRNEEFYDEEWVPSVLDAFAKDLVNVVSAGQDVLDVGCGTGHVTRYAAIRTGSGARVVGLDPTPHFLAAAKANSSLHEIEWVDGSCEELPFPDNSFDIVLCHQAWQYMPDVTTAFRELARVTKPGGLLAGGVWSPSAVQKPFGAVEHIFTRHLGPEIEQGHAFSFGGLERLRELAETSGLEIVRLETIELPTYFSSISHAVNVICAGSGRTLADGSMAMGMFDLDDPTFEPKVEALKVELQDVWASYVSDDGFNAPYFSDILEARAK